MSDLFSLKGKVALVTGASSGLGVHFSLCNYKGWSNDDV